MPKRLLFLLFPLLGCICWVAGGQSPATTRTVLSPARPIAYVNALYGFRFMLPATWKGYSALIESWSGSRTTAAGEQEGPGGKEKGPLVRLRHPRWTAARPYEDIPIMVFTHAQWELVENFDKPDNSGEGLVTSAAPIQPMELARNATYVFALPPRYNFDYATGWKEVETILAAKPIRTFAPLHPPPATQ